MIFSQIIGFFQISLENVAGWFWLEDPFHGRHLEEGVQVPEVQAEHGQGGEPEKGGTRLKKFKSPAYFSYKNFLFFKRFSEKIDKEVILEEKNQ